MDYVLRNFHLEWAYGNALYTIAIISNCGPTTYWPCGTARNLLCFFRNKMEIIMTYFIQILKD